MLAECPVQNHQCGRAFGFRSNLWFSCYEGITRPNPTWIGLMGALGYQKPSLGSRMLWRFFLSSRVMSHSTYSRSSGAALQWEDTSDLRGKRSVLKMACSRFVGSNAKGDVGSTVTQGLNYFGSTLLFPLGCFTINMQSNQIQSYSEDTRMFPVVKQQLVYSDWELVFTGLCQ